MNKHTPGPWESYSQRKDNGPEYGFMISSSTDKDADWLCEVNGNFEQDEANAHLIKASPELLEALKAIADPQESGNLSGPASRLYLAQQIARIAIAKVEGGGK